MILHKTVTLHLKKRKIMNRQCTTIIFRTPLNQNETSYIFIISIITHISNILFKYQNRKEYERI